MFKLGYVFLMFKRMFLPMLAVLRNKLPIGHVRTMPCYCGAQADELAILHCKSRGKHNLQIRQDTFNKRDSKKIALQNFAGQMILQK